ncbi:hypothetical protein PORCRE_812 [Porphyromonas crevioricanis JCM 15906]|nr:hypothetical protein PORCRE_812 [Porphyromonas crevioricanis JCM 15906]GAD07350.1 hypothetical protein PORCAN_970 [Porphyromonas crevioricanis JCM 13913]
MSKERPVVFFLSIGAKQPVRILCVTLAVATKGVVDGSFVRKTLIGMDNEFLQIEEDIVGMLKTVYDPEIPVNIYDLGLIYKVDIKDDGLAHITMTLTAPNCPAADFIVEDVKMKVGSVKGIRDVQVDITFEPEWSKEMMSEEALLELGFM